MPLQLLTDRGPESEGELFTELCKWMEIDKIRTTAYRAATNGVVERFHRTLNAILGNYSWRVTQLRQWMSSSQKDNRQ